MPELKREINGEVGNVKYALIRRDPYTLLQDLPKFFETLQIKEIVSVCQTETNGNITISLFYR